MSAVFFLLGHILKGPNKHLVVNLCTAINDYTAVYTQAVKVGNILSRSWIPFSAIWQSSIWQNSKKVEPVSSVRRIATSTGVVKRFVKKRAQVAKNGGWGRIRRASTVLYHQGCWRVLIVVPTFSPRQIRDGGGMGVPHTMYR